MAGAGLAAALLALAACSLPMMKALTRSGAQAPPAARCGECHVEDTREWQASPHAMAFRSAAFTAQTLGHQVQSCLPCHAPETAFPADGNIRLRASKREEGVNCIACHLVQGKQCGPFAPGPLTPHPTATEPERYHSAALCGGCHQGAYRTWQAAQAADARIKTCQQCHMPPVRRKLTQATSVMSKGIVALHQEHVVGRHTFSAAAPLKEQPAVAIEVAADGPAACRVRVRNLLPHAMPDGDFGYRKIELAAEWLDGAGRPAAAATRAFFKTLGTQLKPGQSAELRLAAPAPVNGKVHVRLARRDERGAVVYVIAEETREPAPEGHTQ